MRFTPPTNRAAKSDQTWIDDGCAVTFAKRLDALRESIAQSKRDGDTTFYNRPAVDKHSQAIDEEEDEDQDGGFIDEAGVEEPPPGDKPVSYAPHDTLVTDAGLTVPTFIHAQLFPHQRECLEWLHHLHERNTGGILGDEMGLGKTVQVAAFVGAMFSTRRLRTVLLLCPASVLLQWVREFHKWYPWLRVVLLHASGSGVSRAGRTYAELIDEVMQLTETEDGGGVVVSTYENVRQYQDLFVDLEWDYVVLDEGHRIRNPDAEITLVCKQLKTVHRLILTGTPIQNRLRELWSLFDFVYPGKLGTLPTFEDEFVLPIRTGGYANASKMQIVMAYKCALALKDVIHPFMLRRTKKEVQHITKMPEKMEQIIFCSLTPRQCEVYEAYLASSEVAAVLRQDIRPFRAISILRHICNHPDLLATVGEGSKTDSGRTYSTTSTSYAQSSAEEVQRLAQRAPGVPYGDVEASGKMLVLQRVLRMWKQQGHRVLLFSQTRKMLDILQRFMAQEGHSYCRLDGTTSVKERQSLLDAFNREDSVIFVFLLTTRAGGIGVNLTGADRVLIFDPDWNPSTDLQARERSWRLGQTKQVTIYRLITGGTIEEKIYHRQIFKQYLTSKVLHDAKRKRCFNKHTLRDLFILGDQSGRGSGDDGGVETTDVFIGGNVQVLVDTESMEEGEEKEEEEDEEEEEKADKASANTGTDNDAILKHLFSSGHLHVRSVFNHDVVESDGVQNQEADLIELESSKIAQSALSTLRASCAMVRQQRSSLFTPTWTGRSGAAGDPTQAPPRFGNRVARGRAGSSSSAAGVATSASNPFAQPTTSSRDMLRRIKNRKNGITASASSTPAATTRGHVNAATGFLKPDEIAKQLHAFLLSRCTGRSITTSEGVTTEELLDAFAEVVAPKDKLVFRTLLRDMAVCRRKKWVVKPEYLHTES